MPTPKFRRVRGIKPLLIAGSERAKEYLPRPGAGAVFKRNRAFGLCGFVQRPLIAGHIAGRTLSID